MSATAIPAEENVDLLLEQHGDAVKALRAACPDLAEQAEYPYYDDIYFLRYVLMFPKTEDAAEAVQKCLTWRKEHADYVENLPENLADSPILKPIIETAQKYRCVSQWDSNALTDNGFLYVIRTGLGDANAIASALTTEEKMRLMFAVREQSWRHLDKVTRETRRLAKQITLMDMKDTSMGQLNRKEQRKMNPVLEVSTYVFPGQIRKIVFVNAPRFAAMAMSVMKGFMPKKVANRMEMHASADKFFASPFAKQMFNQDLLPSFVGGSVEKLPPGLSGELLSTETALVEEKVRARGTAETTVPIPSNGATLHLMLSLESYDINYEISLRTGTLKEGQDSGEDDESAFEFDGQTTVVQEQTLLKADDGTAKLSFSGLAAGLVTIRWDNSKSVFRGKTVRYAARVDTPHEGEQEAAGGGGAEKVGEAPPAIPAAE